MGGNSVVVISTRGVDDDATALVTGTATLLLSAWKPSRRVSRRHCLASGSLILGWRDAIA